MVIDEETQVGADGLGGSREEGAWGEIHHPEVVDGGGLETLGGAGGTLAEQITASVGIELVLLKPPVNGGNGRQSGIGLFPLFVEEFDVDAREGTDLIEDPLLLFGGKTAGPATVLASLWP